MKLLLYTNSDGKRANRNSVIAAGGIANGRVLAAMVLGADAVQVGVGLRHQWNRRMTILRKRL
jgi:dihydroorotate dehydrogenase